MCENQAGLHAPRCGLELGGAYLAVRGDVVQACEEVDQDREQQNVTDEL